MERPRCADDFATIRARIAELHRQRAQSTTDDVVQSATEPSLYPDRRDPVAVQRAGIPGWRVSRRKRPPSQP